MVRPTEDLGRVRETIAGATETLAKDMEELLAKSCFDAVEPGFNCKWTPQQTEIEAAEKYGYDFALKLKAE